MKPFDFWDGLDIYYGDLPHWRQEGATYFVTFRLADALPEDVGRRLKQERETWHRTHAEPWTPEEAHRYHRLFSERVHEWLDAGHGSCVMRDRRCARIVADSLLHFEGIRYALDSWVVMPNHTHVVVEPAEDFQLEDILQSWTNFSAHKINALIDRQGTLWQHEPYDHIVRHEAELQRLRVYIRENPVKAGLNDCLGSWNYP